MEQAEIRRIIEEVRSGSTAAYAGLVRRHQQMVLSVCASMLGASDAEDAAQEVFLKAFRSLGKFQAAASFSTWLYRIATNHCLDTLKKASRQREESWDALLERDGELSPGSSPPARSESAALEDKDLVERILSGLKPEYRAILVLRELQGLSYRELAETLDCSIDSVKALLRRAREAFMAGRDTFQEPRSSNEVRAR
ncbi:MAG: sigma-70 family RNA polymerase sigma factor [Elusimicrobiota bacterium]